MVWEFFHYANLARKGQITFKNGRIIVTSLRVLFTDVDMLQGMVEKIQDLLGPEEGSRIAYEVSRNAGSRATQAHYRFSGKQGEDMVHYMEKMASGAGWGRISIVDASPDGVIEVYDSPFKLENAKRPTCDFLRGLFAGSMSYIYRRRIDCVESECVSQGAKKCVFLLGKRERLLKMPRLKKIAYQLDLKEKKNERFLTL